jgi:hypothetical protein
MGIKTDLNIAPYFDDYDISKKYYRVLFKPGFAVQARELTQLQTTLQNQIEQFGENIYKEGSIIKGCTFTELRNLRYLKVVDRIVPITPRPEEYRPEDFIERTVIVDQDTIEEYYYEIEDASDSIDDNNRLKALVVQGTSGFQSRSPDLNTFFIVYLNTSIVGTTEKKEFELNDSLQIREYILRTITENRGTENEVVTATTVDNGIVATTSVAGFSNPVGKSFGLNASEGIIFQRGHFLFVDDQTIIVKKYLDEEESVVEFEIQPNNISVGYDVDERIISSQQDNSLLDNANGSPNENAPGADRLLLVPKLVARDTIDAERDSNFFILRRYENGLAVETRDVTQFNSISQELARRTYETHGDFTKKPFQFEIQKQQSTDEFFIEMGEGIAYAKGFRISNDTKRFFRVPRVETTETVPSQPVNFNYGGFVRVLSIEGNLDIRQFQNVALQNDALQVIGSAIIKNLTENRLYLFGIRMNSGQNFNSVKWVGSGASGKIEISPKVINSTESRLVFDFNRPFTESLDNIQFSIRKTFDTATDGTGRFEISPGPNEVFNSDSIKDLLVVSRSGQLEKIGAIGSLLPNGNINVQSDAASRNVTVYYNANQIDVQPRVKELVEIYVKTTYNNSDSIYTLGIPDGIELLEIKDENNNDFTDSFKLVSNQKDDFYDHSYIEKITGGSTPSNNAVLTVKFKAFRIDASSGINFFAISSYDNIDISNIPYFYTSDGKVFDLKSCLDFRPYRLPIAAYSTNIGGATVMSVTDPKLPTAGNQIFSPGIEYFVPAVNTSGSMGVTYYGSRVDYIVGSSYGRFKYITGGETGSASGRIDTKETTIIAEISVPGYPLLSPSDAYRLNRKNESISISTSTVSTYTMKDIDRLAKRLERLTYYVTLSALETSTRNLLIQDENGNNRFKNGIIVDPFTDLSIADVSDANFNASVDTSDTTLRPSLKQFPLDLRVKSSSANNTSTVGPLTTLSFNQTVKFVNQQYATGFRSCTSNVYNFIGVGALTPEYDVAYDTTTTPVEIDIDISRSFIDFTDALSEFVPLTTQQSNLLREWNETQTSTAGRGKRSSTTTTTQTFQEWEDVFRTLSVSGGDVQQNFVGDFVTNFQFRPFMRSREIQIEMYGLRPNTRHFFFFDTVDVNEHVANGTSTLDSMIDGFGTVFARPQVVRSQDFGEPVRTNERGELFAIFRIPESTFFVGERELVIADIDSYENIDSAAASIGKLKYNAYNFDVQKAGLTTSTRYPNIAVLEERTTRTVMSREVQQGQRNKCPLAQTFFVKDAMTNGADALFLQRVSLFFKRKSETNGVTVQIREVENGYPGWEVVAFGRKHLRTTEVNISDDGTARTDFIFDAPVRLDAEKEYAIVVQPDADDPDYLIFTTRPGGVDLSTGETINADWGDGVLFTSTNNRAWTAYQNEDVKFELYRYNYNVNSGNIQLETTDYEFFACSESSSKFINNELAYTFKGTATRTINLTTNNNQVTGPNLIGLYNVGDYFYIETPQANRFIFRIISIDTNIMKIDSIPSISGSFVSRPIVAGNVTYFNPRRPDMLVLEKSSARSGRVFSPNDVVRGIQSDATARISTVENIELSYIQAMINRVTDANTNVKVAVRAIDPTNDASYEKGFEFSANKAFNERGCIVYSKSNDVNQEKNLRLILTLEKDDIPTTTPIVDIETAQLFAYIYQITNDINTTAKYISKRVELQEGFDAEDFRLYLTGYRPVGTDIKVYVRLKNASDPVSLQNNPWIELEKTSGADLFSSTSNTSDFKEFVYSIPDTNKNSGVVRYTNDTGVYSGYRSFAIRIDMLSTNIASVPKVLDYRGIAFE